jgi:regulator of replication initiation timing
MQPQYPQNQQELFVQIPLSQYDYLQKQIQNLHQQLIAKDNTIQNITANNNELMLQNANLRELYSIASQRNTQLYKEIQQSKNSIYTVLIDNKNCYNKNEELQKEVLNTKESYQSVIQQLDNILSFNKTLMAENATQKNTINQLSKALSAAQNSSTNNKTQCNYAFFNANTTTNVVIPQVNNVKL